MELKNDIELANTRKKLQMLEEAYQEDMNDTTEDNLVRELTLRSLKRLINQLKEEIIRYEAHHQPARSSASFWGPRRFGIDRSKPNTIGKDRLPSGFRRKVLASDGRSNPHPG